MGYLLIKKKVYLIIISFLFVIIKSINYGPDDDDIGKLRDELKRRKDEYDDLIRDEEIFELIYKILLGFIIFLLIIILPVIIYEIVHCCNERKRELKRRELIVKNISKSKIAKNFSLKISNASYSSIDDEKNEGKIANSFHSSNMLASTILKREINNNSNNVIEKSNLKESNFSRLRLNSGYEAPSIVKMDHNKNKEEKLLTNDINIEEENNIYKN